MNEPAVKPTTMTIAISAVKVADFRIMPIHQAVLKRRDSATDERSMYGNASGWQYVEPKTAPPAGKWKLPDLVSTQPLYYQAKFVDKDRLLVFDCAARGDRFYNKAYFDANANGDLTDDKPLTATLRESAYENDRKFFSTEFGRIDIQIGIDGTKLPFRLSPSISYSGPWSADGKITEPRALYGNLQSWCVYTGAFDLKGMKYRLVLGDNDVNGDFSGRHVSGGRDSMFLLRPGEQPQWDFQMSLPDVLVAEGQTFDVDINMARQHMTLSPTSASKSLPAHRLRWSSPNRLYRRSLLGARRAPRRSRRGGSSGGPLYPPARGR